MRLRLCSAIAVFLAIGGAAQAEIPGISVAITPVFPDERLSHAYALTITNDGAPIRGQVAIGTSFSAVFLQRDFDLESHKSARLEFEGDTLEEPQALQPTDSVNVKLTSDRGNDEERYPVASLASAAGSFAPDPVLVIGRGLFRNQASAGFHWEASRVLPDKAPVESELYRGRQWILLEPGAEKIPQAALDSILERVVGGARLLIAGGPRSPLLVDQRLKALTGEYPDGQVVVRQSHTVALLGKSVASPSAPLLNLKVLPEATCAVEDGQAIAVRRSVGRGSVIALAFDPYDPAYEHWAGWQTLMKELINSHRTGPEVVIENSKSAQPAISHEAVELWWLDFKALSVSTLAIVLFLYLILAGPINFWLLERWKRRELAWVTAPALSVIFAIFLYSRASAMINMPDASSQVLFLVADSAVPFGRFFGSGEMFSRDSGMKVVAMKGADEVNVGGMPTPQQHDPETIALVQSLRAHPISLGLQGDGRTASFESEQASLRNFVLSGRVTSDFLTLTRTSGGVRIEARTNLRHMTLATRDGIYRVGDLAAGQSEVVGRANLLSKISIVKPSRKSDPEALNGWPQVRNNIFAVAGLEQVALHRMVLEGQAPDLPVGIFFGQRHAQNTFVYFAEDPR